MVNVLSAINVNTCISTKSATNCKSGKDVVHSLQHTKKYITSQCISTKTRNLDVSGVCVKLPDNQNAVHSRSRRPLGYQSRNAGVSKLVYKWATWSTNSAPVGQTMKAGSSFYI
jgi:hypothetical protein